MATDLLEKPVQRPNGEVSSISVPVTVLSTDEPLCEAVRAAADGRQLVFVASTAEQAVEFAATDRCAILITDQGLTRAKLEQLNQLLREHEPALVTIAVGGRGDDNALIGLLSTGVADRFMLKPLMPALVKLALKSAAREHQALKSRPRIGTVPPVQSKALQGKPVPNTLVQDKSVPAPSAPAPSISELSIPALSIPGQSVQNKPSPAKLAQARVAAAESIQAKSHQVTKSEKPQSKPLTTAQAAITAVRPATYPRRDQVRSAPEQSTPEQLSPEQSAALPDAEAPVRLEESVATSNETAQPAGEFTVTERRTIPQPSWIVMLAAVIAVAVAVWWVMAQRMPDIDPRQVIATNLTAAQQAFAAGRYLDPPEHSALHHYSAVLSLEPSNSPARQGIESIAGHFIDNFSELLTSGRLVEAMTALESVRRVDPAHQQLPVLEAQLRKGLQDRLLVQTNEATNSSAVPAQNVPDKTAAANRKAVVKKSELANAEMTADTNRNQLGTPEASKMSTGQQASLSAAGQDSGVRGVAVPVQAGVTAQSSIAPGGQLSRPGVNEIAANHSGQSAAQSVAVANSTSAAAVPNAQAGQAVAGQVIAPTTPSASTTTPSTDPRLLKLVKPEYPNEALMRGIEGWVDVSLLVTAAGDVADVRVEGSSRRQLFERPALSAVRQWKYSPRPANDPSLKQRVKARVEFRRE